MDEMPATGQWRTRSIAVLGAILCLGLLPAAASADHTVLMTPEGEMLPSMEVGALGSEHAAEHAAKPEATSRSAYAETAPSVTPENSLTGAEPNEVGRWVAGPAGVIDLPNYAIHAVMLPTGKVLFWGYPPTPEDGTRPNGGDAAVWDPAKGTGPDSTTEVDPPLLDPDGPGPQGEVPAPLYCSGQTLLPNGDVLATGGNLVWPAQYQDDNYGDYAGLNTIYVFDPFAERWVRQPNMRSGRWYPSQVLLGDGRTPIIGGYTEAESPSGRGATDTQLAEVFTAADANGGQGTVQQVAEGADFETALYPHLFTLPNDLVLLAGPAAGDSARLSFSKGQPAGALDIESPPDGRNRIGGTAVLEPGGYRGSWTAHQFGGYDDKLPVDPDVDPSEYEYRSITTSVRTDGKELKASFGEATVLGRSYANTVLLPDRSMVTVGGGAGRDEEIGNYFVADDVRRKQVEVYDPESDSWRLGPNQREYRAYHSTALLLPDGRVWSAGDDYHEVEPKQSGDGFKSSTRDTAEIYEPAYLFASGRRPRIQGVAKQLSYGDTFGIKTLRGRGEDAVLIAPGATTHAADMHQRLVTLKNKGKVERKGLNMKTPLDPAVAPPGYYMLFVLSRSGKPSHAEWVKLSPEAPKSRQLREKKHHKHAKHGKRGKGKKGSERGR